MSSSGLRPTTVLRGRIEEQHHGSSWVSFEMEGCSVELPERGAASPVEDGQVVTVIARRKFWPSSEHVALAFAEQVEGKAHPVGRGIHLLGVFFGLPIIAAVITLRVMHGPSGYRGGDESMLWPGMVIGGIFVAYSVYRTIEITHAVKRLREQLPTLSAYEKTGVS